MVMIYRVEEGVPTPQQGLALGMFVGDLARPREAFSKARQQAQN